MKTICIAIGNSDDKLSQVQWAGFCEAVEEFVDKYSHEVYAKTYALTNAQWQNAVFLFAAPEATTDYIRRRVAVLAYEWKQESIAVLIGDSVLVPAKLTPEPQEEQKLGEYTDAEGATVTAIEVQHGFHRRNAMNRFRPW